MGFPDSSAGKESAYNAGDPGLIPGLGRSPGEGIGYPLQYFWASLVAQLVKNPPAMWETWVRYLGWWDWAIKHSIHSLFKFGWYKGCVSHDLQIKMKNTVLFIENIDSSLILIQCTWYFCWSLVSLAISWFQFNHDLTNAVESLSSNIFPKEILVLKSYM